MFIFLIVSILLTPLTTKTTLGIILFILIELFLISMFLKAILTTKNFKERRLAFFAYIVNAILLLICIFISNIELRLTILFVYNIAFTGGYLYNYAHYKTKFKTGKLYSSNCLAPSLIIFVECLTNIFYHTYTSLESLMLYSLIPTLILFLVLVVLVCTTFKETLKKFCQTPAKKVCYGFLAIISFYGIGILTLDLANTTVKPQPTKIECLILKKHSSTKHIPKYTLYVSINNQEYNIYVSSKIYYSKEINDTLTVNYYNGFLNLSYYTSAE